MPSNVMNMAASQQGEHPVLPGRLPGGAGRLSDFFFHRRLRAAVHGPAQGGLIGRPALAFAQLGEQAPALGHLGVDVVRKMQHAGLGGLRHAHGPEFQRSVVAQDQMLEMALQLGLQTRSFQIGSQHLHADLQMLGGDDIHGLDGLAHVIGHDDLAVGVREGVEEDTNKRNTNDFVLWYTKSKFENQALKWDSPWGIGYPGWHIECSGISMKYNGEYLDLHCGGVDNAFPHHTNEIAQSESYLGHPWCPHWCHVAHLNTTDGKMSKSKGEFLTVSLLEQKGYDPLAYRFFCLQSHYRKSLVFTWENLDNAVLAYNKLLAKIAYL